jgi:hypothetical protein
MGFLKRGCFLQISNLNKVIKEKRLNEQNRMNKTE